MPFKNHEKSMLVEVTPISNIFIDKFLITSPAVYGIVYIYSFRMFICGNYNIKNSEIASALDILESDVIKAWKYWDKKGIVSYDTETETIEFKHLSEEKLKPSVPISLESTVPPSPSPQYSPEELAAYTDKNESIKELFEFAQSKFGNLLTQKQMSKIFSFHDWLGLPLDVIKELLSYCAKTNHFNMRYIEKVAISWADKGIFTLEQAKENIKLYNVSYREVMKSFGQGNRSPLPFEEQFMKKWFNDYNFSVDIIKMACERTISKLGKPSFEYANSIIENWHKKNIKTIDDILLLDKTFKEEQENKKFKTEAENRKNPAPQKRNRFVNYEQREWDWDKIEKLEMKYRKKNLEG